jgi:hypothetical protein
MIEMDKAIAVIDVVNQFPVDRYNILIPQKTITQLSPFHRFSINVVQLDSNADNGDVYPLNGKLAPAKNGILKLANAAGIQVKSIRTVDPTSCGRCKPSPACRECPNNEDLAVEVEVLMPDGAGGYRSIIATREWLAKDEKDSAMSFDKKTGKREFNPALFAQAKRFRKPITETKALLRALRDALSIKATYTAAELKKPFVVPVVTLNYDDPALRDAVAKRLACGIDAVFGSPKPITALPVNVDAADVEDHDESEEERKTIAEADVVDTTVNESKDPRDDMDFANFDDPAMPGEFEQNALECSECGSPIEDYVRQKDGQVWPADKIVETTMKYFNRPACARCYFKARNKKEAAA